MPDWSRTGARERVLRLVACLVAVAVGSAGYLKSGVDLTAVEAASRRHASSVGTAVMVTL
jgi:hypothetical protein